MIKINKNNKAKHDSMETISNGGKCQLLLQRNLLPGEVFVPSTTHKSNGRLTVPKIENRIFVDCSIKKNDPVKRYTLVKMIKQLEQLLISIAKQHPSPVCPQEDLCVEGVIGLIEGFMRFDETKGYTFLTYCVPYINKRISIYVYTNISDKNVPAGIGRLLRTYAQKGLYALAGIAPFAEHIFGFPIPAQLSDDDDTLYVSKILNISTSQAITIKKLYAEFLDKCRASKLPMHHSEMSQSKINSYKDSNFDIPHNDEIVDMIEHFMITDLDMDTTSMLVFRYRSPLYGSPLSWVRLTTILNIEMSEAKRIARAMFDSLKEGLPALFGKDTISVSPILSLYR